MRWRCDRCGHELEAPAPRIGSSYLMPHVCRVRKLVAAIRSAEPTTAGDWRVGMCRPVSYYDLTPGGAFDTRPEHCWRCDAKGAETDVGLCTPCHDDLRAS
jgi:hypothetical protein